jgi:hypothetical protein
MAASCGDKKSDAPRRKGLGPAVRKYEEFRQKDVQRFDSAYSAKAASHTAGRNQALAQLLCCMSLMRSLGDIVRPQLELKWSKAQVGAVTGTVAVPAAHCLPCQLWIDNTKPWDLVHSALVDRGKLSKILKEDIFGHETILPLPFNLADSLSETNCLRGSLVAACEYVIAHTKPSQRRGGVLKRSGDGTILLKVEDRPDAANAGIDHQAVKDGYGIWQTQAAAAFAAATEEARKGVRYNETDYTEDVLYILDKYERSLTRVPPRASDQGMWSFENDLWV